MDARKRASGSLGRNDTSAAHHHIEDRAASILRGGKRVGQRAGQFRAPLYAPPMEFEMAAQLLVIRALDGHPEMQIGAGGSAIGIMVDMTLAHRLVFLVVEDDDGDRQLVPLRRAERL